VTASPVTGAGAVSALVADHVRQVADFPRPGILFRDLTPLFADGPAFRAVVDAIVAHHGPFDEVAGIEARGFLIAAAVGYATGAGVVPIRKAGKLPGETLTVDYALEYGNATLEVHTDAFTPGARVLLVDDVLATGGTAAAAAELVERAGATVVGLSVLMELDGLGGRVALAGRSVDALLTVR
jgi:adenine phosphoribosyltransferase